MSNVRNEVDDEPSFLSKLLWGLSILLLFAGLAILVSYPFYGLYNLNKLDNEVEKKNTLESLKTYNWVALGGVSAIVVSLILYIASRYNSASVEESGDWDEYSPLQTSYESGRLIV